MFNIRPNSAWVSHLSAAAVLSLACQWALAEPWVASGDERTRHHLQVLADTGKLNLPLTSWPVMWSGIKSELDSIKVEQLETEELWSYRYLRHTLEKAMRINAVSIQLRGSNTQTTALNRFADEFREGTQSRASTSFIGEHLSFKLQHEYVVDPVLDSVENTATRFDGSYIAGTWNNWVMGAGAIDRWWGPGWNSSLLLSNNARPAPSIFIKRKDTSSTRNDGLWHNAWDLNLFAGKLIEDRTIENPYLSGARLTLKPFRFLEMGISTTQIFGGKAADADSETSSGTLNGLDWRLGKSINGIQIAIYQQLAERSLNNPSPDTATASLSGIELSALFLGASHRLVLETEDTRNGELSLYDHAPHIEGYRRYGRNIGSAIDTASQSTSVSGSHHLSIGHQIYWRLGKAKLNADNIALESPAGHPYGNTSTELDFANISYKLPVTEQVQLELGASHFSTPINFGEQQLDNSSYLQINIEF